MYVLREGRCVAAVARRRWFGFCNAIKRMGGVGSREYMYERGVGRVALL
jgi:hypothetical protein